MAIIRCGRIIASVCIWLLLPVGADFCSGTFDVPGERPDADVRQHNGAKLSDVCVSHDGPYHVFVIGDWGGTGDPPKPAENRGNLQDPVDYDAQQRVAEQMHKLGLEVNVDYVLNVGDSFYWGGIDKTCWETIEWSDQWATVYNNVYSGAGLAGIPWLGVLGNHDYGGWRYDSGWPQIITMSWVDQRWRIPAQYWSVRVRYSDFDVDYYFLDSNAHSCADPSANPKHNVCSTEHQGDGMNCSGIGGPGSVAKCPDYFLKLWDEQVDWLKDRLSKSTATWRIVVTHIPPEPGTNWEELARNYGIDLIVTGHVHYQLFWGANDDANPMKPTSVIISGGGGGITSEDIPREAGDDDTYGFVDLTLTEDAIDVRMISHGGKLRRKARIKHCYAGDGAEKVILSCADGNLSQSSGNASALEDILRERANPEERAPSDAAVQDDVPAPSFADWLKQLLGWSREAPAEEAPEPEPAPAPEGVLLPEEAAPVEPAPGDLAAAEEGPSGDGDPDTGEETIPPPTFTDRLKQTLGWSSAGRVLRAEPPLLTLGGAVAFVAAALSPAVFLAACRRASRAAPRYSTLDVRHALIEEAPGLRP